MSANQEVLASQVTGMAHAAGSILRQIESVFEGGSVAGLTDRQLLERFTAGRDAARNAAFAALVTRYGPMVLGVCRQVLGDRHLAEDVFQAVFLVLARKAFSIRDPARLGAWLYRAAILTARKAKVRLDRRRRHEDSDAMRRPDCGSRIPLGLTARPSEESVLAREQAEALHEEIDRLPPTFRLAVVLCYFEGLALDEAAHRLGWPVGTLRSRLARARDKLRRGLSRRGVILSGTALTAALTSSSASASVPSSLCDMTTRAAIRFAAGPANRAARAALTTALAQEVLGSMLIHRLRLVAMAVLFLGAVASSAACLIPLLHASALSREGEPRSRTARTEPPPPDPTRPAPGRMFIVGSVLDPQGKPVPNATVAISLRRKLLFSGVGSEGGFPAPAGHGASDASGRFRLDAARTSSAHHAWFAATALAPGYGVGWADLDPEEDRPSAEIRLMPEQVIQGRLFDVQGRPVPGAVVSVSAIWRTLPLAVPALSQGLIENNSEGPYRWWCRVHDGPGWPRPATTDADGRFTLHGIGRGLHARLSVLDPRFAPQTIEVATDAPAGVQTLKAALVPARTLNGRVTYADTRRPAAHAEVHVGVNVGPGGVQQGGVRFLQAEADAEGRFRVSVMPGDRLHVWAAAPDGQSYLHAAANLAWPKGATEQAVDLALPRGVLIRGKVTEEGTGQPVADALVFFSPSTPRAARTGAGGPALTKPDGSFALAVGPHPGHLSVQAPGEDYQLQVISGARFYGGNLATGRRLYAHAFFPHDPRPGAETSEIRVALRRGATVRFRLIGPDGQPARDVRVYSRAVLGPSVYSAVRGWPLTWIEVARRGHFEVHGLDPETEVPVHFLQPDRKLGATVRVSGQIADQGPVTVRLEPCGLARARLVDPDGKPVTGQTRGVSVTMVITPGPPARSAPVRAGALAADEDSLDRIDPVNHGHGWAADAKGQITWPALIPGATYRLIARGVGDGPQVGREFVVGPGEALELGDVQIQKPPG
jgi:RNA polymerase sigma factor (sigma-70 family)